MPLGFRFDRLNKAQMTNAPQVRRQIEICLCEGIEQLLFLPPRSHFQSSTVSSNLVDHSLQSSPLDQPAVITATSQPAANPTANQKKLANPSEQTLHNPSAVLR